MAGEGAGRRRLAPAVSLAIAGIVAGAGTAAAADAWADLERARAALAAAPRIADFVQTYQPAGFTSGERETGRLFLDLPRCLRWDYEIPYPKSFLLCESTVWTWNQGEEAGRRFPVDPGEERGLDLLRLGIEELRQRYRAARGAGGGLEIELTPLDGSAGQVVRATFTLDPATGRPAALAWEDPEGNRTRFELSGYRPLEEALDATPDGDGPFTPPAAVEWLDE